MPTTITFYDAVKKNLRMRGGKNSVSCLMQDLRYDGWRRMGKMHWDFIPRMKDMGFKVEEVGSYTYVSEPTV